MIIAQKEHGWVSDEVKSAVAGYLNLSLIEVDEVALFTACIIKSPLVNMLLKYVTVFPVICVAQES